MNLKIITNTKIYSILKTIIFISVSKKVHNEETDCLLNTKWKQQW
jgi:hypothetical protein